MIILKRPAVQAWTAGLFSALLLDAVSDKC